MGGSGSLTNHNREADLLRLSTRVTCLQLRAAVAALTILDFDRFRDL